MALEAILTGTEAQKRTAFQALVNDQTAPQDVREAAKNYLTSPLMEYDWGTVFQQEIQFGCR